MTTRRNFLKAAAPAVLAVAIPAITTAHPENENFRIAADRLCQDMAGQLGGEWKAHVEHDFVLISRLYR